MKLSSLNEETFVVLNKETYNTDEINNFCMNNYWNKSGIFVKFVRKGSMRWIEWKRFQGSTFDTFSKRKLVEDRDTIFKLTA